MTSQRKEIYRCEKYVLSPSIWGTTRYGLFKLKNDVITSAGDVKTLLTLPASVDAQKVGPEQCFNMALTARLCLNYITSYGQKCDFRISCEIDVSRDVTTH